MKDKSITSAAANTTSAVLPWSGRIDEFESQRPGGLLMGALMACAAERGQGITELATSLGFVYGYLTQLRTGTRKVSSISDDFARASAEYLGVSMMEVLMLAGRVTPEDFSTSPSDYDQELARAMSFISQDREWGSLVPSEMRAPKAPGQHLIVRLYEKATGAVLLRNKGRGPGPNLLAQV